MEVNSDLKRAQVESVAGDPAGANNPQGRFYLETNSDTVKVKGASAVLRVVDNVSHGYFGVPDGTGVFPDGSWRITIDAGKLAFEKKEAGVWNKYGEFGE